MKSINAWLPALVAALAATACAEVPTAVDGSQLPAAFVTNTTWGENVGSVSSVFPSTNELNAGRGWAHVEYLDTDVGSVVLDFHQPRAFYACFEYRVDDETPTSSQANPNSAVTDGLWTYTCRSASSETRSIAAQRHVDVRMAFGAEGDERFDWTRFYAPTSQESKAMCKDEPGWEALGFQNLGQCVRFAETGEDSRP